MNAPFYYKVKAKLIRFAEDSKIDFLEFEDRFEDEDPIVARGKAFEHYQNYIDVLLEGKGLTYTSDKQAREDLKSFIDPGTRTYLKIGDKDIELKDSFGIGVFLIIDKPIADPILDEKTGDELFIHGIGNISYAGDRPDILIFELQREYEYFKHFNLSTAGRETEVSYCDREELEAGLRDEPERYTVLSTPFDWFGYDVEFWWELYNRYEEIDQAPVSIQDIIKAGENNQVEFKPSLLYNFLSGKPGISIKALIARAISAFLNSNGGLVIIGIQDNGNIQGLEYDFSLANGRDPRDFFRLEFDQMLDHFLSFSVKNNVTGEFYELEGKDIFVVTVTPNNRRPIFLNGQQGKEFYVRGEASTRQLKDIEDIANYCIEKWSTIE